MRDEQYRDLNNHAFTTCDTLLAAFLVCKGTQLISTKQDGKSTIFVFGKPDEQLLFDFTTGVATANVRNLFHTYKSMLKLVHGRKAPMLGGQ